MIKKGYELLSNHFCVHEERLKTTMSHDEHDKIVNYLLDGYSVEYLRERLQSVNH